MTKVKFFVYAWLFLVCCSLIWGCKPVTATAQEYPASKGECVMEVQSKRILYAQNADTRLPMASTTKIVTCMTVLKDCDNLEDVVTIPKEAVGIEGSSVYLKEGDCYTVKDLLYGLMLRSGNDCAVALALYCQGSIQAFAKRMNDFAESAGAVCSRFSNPHGLPAKNHYTTAYDLALMSCVALQDPVFSEIVSTKYYEPRNWYNKNKLLTDYDNATGVKTGFTKEAGRCLVSSAKRNNMHVVGVVLHSPMMFERSKQLLNDAFQTYTMTRLIDKGETLQNENVIGECDRDCYYPLCDGEKQHVECRIQPCSTKNKRNIVGQFEIYLAKRLLFSGNLYKL